MFEAGFIDKCSSPELQTEIVEQFLISAGRYNPLSVTVSQGAKVVLIPPAITEAEALELVRKHAGIAIVRVGISQYPINAARNAETDIDAELFEPCSNLRHGTELFAEIYKTVSLKYGLDAPDVFENAIVAYKTGWFEGMRVFDQVNMREGWLGGVVLERNSEQMKISAASEAEKLPELGKIPVPKPARTVVAEPQTAVGNANPHNAATRIDLSRLKTLKNRSEE